MIRRKKKKETARPMVKKLTKMKSLRAARRRDLRGCLEDLRGFDVVKGRR